MLPLCYMLWAICEHPQFLVIFLNFNIIKKIIIILCNMWFTSINQSLCDPITHSLTSVLQILTWSQSAVTRTTTTMIPACPTVITSSFPCPTVSTWPNPSEISPSLATPLRAGRQTCLSMITTTTCPRVSSIFIVTENKLKLWWFYIYIIINDYLYL